jgi:hypothetical protein
MSIERIPHHVPFVSRRDFLARGGAGFGALAMSYLLGAEPLRAQERPGPLSPKLPHAPARARSVIFLFMEGAPSSLDLFDPKPKLRELGGKPLPPSFGPVITAMGEYNAPLMPDRRRWTQEPRTGLWFSDWVPHIARCAPEIAVIRSCKSDALNHSGGVCQMNTGSVLAGRPSLGAWVTYGLGSENSNLPAFVVMQDNNDTVVNGPRNWGAGFMPAVYQGVRLQSGPEPIPNLMTPKSVGPERQRAKLDLLGRLNQAHAEARPDVTELDARIRSYEMAFRMQAEAPEAVDLSRETPATLKLYGLDDPATETFGRLCLLARRLVERGVRFVQLYSGAGSKWDAHSGLEKNHAPLCRSMDLPTAGLLMDLKSRGLLDSTLVVWGGEFGRTPMSEKGDGRDHNPYGFTMWMAGGGVRGGRTIGATDEIGLHAVEEPLHVHDLHATVLHILGVDHTRLTYFYRGRPERIDINDGTAYRQITG